MTVVNPPAFLQNAGAVHTAEVTRSGFNALVSGPRAATSLVSRGGVALGLGGGLAVTQNGTPNMTVNVAAGTALIPGTEGSKQGVYSVLNDATLNVSLAASDPTNPRIDLIVFKVQDTFYSGGSNTSSIVAVTGTPAGSPTPPAAPANSLVLAQIAVAANDTAITTGEITDKRAFLTAAGGIVPYFGSQAPTFSLWPPGTFFYDFDTSGLNLWDGAALKSKELGWIATTTNNTTNANSTGSEAFTCATTFTPVSSERYKFTFTASHSSSVSLDIYRLRLRIKSGATVDNTGTELMIITAQAQAASSGDPTTIWADVTGLSGQHTVGASIQRVVGTGTCTLNASSTDHAKLMIERVK